jgi:hypothetical protein
VLWFAVALVGFGAAAIAFRYSKDGALRASAVLGSWVDRPVRVAMATVSRFVIEPAEGLAGGTEEWIPSRDDALGRSAVATGRLAALATRAPVLPVLIMLAVLLAGGIALISPGVFR